MRDRDHSLLSNAVSLLICGILAGVVVAAAVFPAVAVSGLAAKSGADAFEKLPTEIKTPPAPQITSVFASDSKTQLALLFDENRHDIPLAEVGDIMRQAIIAAEDNRFYSHHGVDPKGVVRAFVANNGGNEETGAQGASTLTMQYVRQALQYNAVTPADVRAATVPTPARKLREIRLAVALEKQLSKEQILERYLNIAYYGHRAYGIHAAAQVYFNKTPKQLTLAEAAMIAGLVQSPSVYDPTTDEGYPKAVVRQKYVLEQMVKLKYASQADVDATLKVATPKPQAHDLKGGCVNVQPNNAGFFCDYLISWWREQKAFGETPGDREDRLKRGGYQITTSLDLGIQNSAVKYLGEVIQNNKSFAIPIAAIEPGTGRVKALAVNRNYSLDQSGNGPTTNPDKKGQKGSYPNTTNALITGGGDIVGYQAGSTFKIFTAVAALQAGYPEGYTINAQPQYVSNKYFISEKGDSGCNQLPTGDWHWCPKNSSATNYGSINMWQAFGNSINTYFVPLIERAGAANAVKVAQSMGIKFRSDAKQLENPDLWGAFTLGVSATTPLDLANAYATLAADGKHCEPIPVVEITDQYGAKVDAANPKCDQALTPDVARGAADIARCPIADQSAEKKCAGDTAKMVHNIIGDRPLAGKTGTTDHTTATLVITTPQLAIAGIANDPDRPTADASGMHDQVNNAVSKTLRDALAGQPKKGFPAPSALMMYGDQKPIPAVTCKSPADAATTIRAAGFTVETSTATIASACPAGTVADTSPTGKAPKGSSVTLMLSKGAAGTTPTAGTGGGGADPGDPQPPGPTIPPVPQWPPLPLPRPTKPPRH